MNSYNPHKNQCCSEHYCKFICIIIITPSLQRSKKKGGAEQLSIIGKFTHFVCVKHGRENLAGWSWSLGSVVCRYSTSASKSKGQDCPQEFWPCILGYLFNKEHPKTKQSQKLSTLICGWSNQLTVYKYRTLKRKSQCTKSMVHRRNIDKLDFIKLKMFFSVKHPVKRIKNKLQIRKNYFQIMYPTQRTHIQNT